MNKRKSVAPCKDCTDRHEYCHGTCERYLKWKKENDDITAEANVKYHAECGSDAFLKGKRSRFRAFGKTGRKK